jgi:hypothetical protein
MIEYILAIAFLMDMETVKPYIVSPQKSKESCMVEAQEKNNKERDFLKSLGQGAEFVCLKIERVTV